MAWPISSSSPSLSFSPPRETDVHVPKTSRVQPPRPEDENLRARDGFETAERTLRHPGRRDRLEIQALPGDHQSPGPERHPRNPNLRVAPEKPRTCTKTFSARTTRPSRSPFFFQLIHGDTIRFAASHKRPSEADGSKWVIEANFQTEPQPIGKDRPPLPVALDLSSL